MILKHAKGNTYYLESDSLLIPVYKVNDRDIILIDTGWKRELEELELSFETYDLNPVGVLGTHTHVDHSRNTGYLMKKYNIPAALTFAEAALGSTVLNLKALYYSWSPRDVAYMDERFRDMTFMPDIIIANNEDTVTLCGATFEVVRTPGHTPDHVAFVTPDDIMCVGDAVLTEDNITRAKLPFFFAIEESLKTMDMIAETNHAGYIAVHKGYYEDFKPYVIECKNEVLDRCERILAVIDHPMNYCEIHQAVCKALCVKSQRVNNYKLFERNIRSFLEYLVDTDQLEIVVEDSMAFYRQK